MEGAVATQLYQPSWNEPITVADVLSLGCTTFPYIPLAEQYQD
jgi:hypothetical protein